jgi:hypothetical protein
MLVLYNFSMCLWEHKFYIYGSTLWDLTLKAYLGA